MALVEVNAFLRYSASLENFGREYLAKNWGLLVLIGELTALLQPIRKHTQVETKKRRIVNFETAACCSASRRETHELFFNTWQTTFFCSSLLWGGPLSPWERSPPERH